MVQWNWRSSGMPWGTVIYTPFPGTQVSIQIDAWASWEFSQITSEFVLGRQMCLCLEIPRPRTAQQIFTTYKTLFTQKARHFQRSPEAAMFPAVQHSSLLCWESPQEPVPSMLEGKGGRSQCGFNPPWGMGLGGDALLNNKWTYQKRD